MAIRLCPGNCSCCFLAHSEQRSTMENPSVTWFILGRAISPVVGLLALPDILSANSVGCCACLRTGHCGRLVGFFAERSLVSAANILCRSPLEQGISWSERW